MLMIYTKNMKAYFAQMKVLRLLQPCLRVPTIPGPRHPGGSDLLDMLETACLQVVIVVLLSLQKLGWVLCAAVHAPAGLVCNDAVAVGVAKTNARLFMRA